MAAVLAAFSRSPPAARRGSKADRRPRNEKQRPLPQRLRKRLARAVRFQTMLSSDPSKFRREFDVS